MTDELEALLPDFQGTFSRTRCFLHILNLVAKAILKQFDVKEVKDPEALVDEDVRELEELVKELEVEEAETEKELREAEGDDYEAGNDEEDDESWVDEIGSLTAEEEAEFEEHVRPVKKVLVKVSARASILIPM